MPLYIGSVLSANYGDGDLLTDVGRVLGTDLAVVIETLDGLQSYYPTQVVEVTSNEAAVVYRRGQNGVSTSTDRQLLSSREGRYLIVAGAAFDTFGMKDMVDRLDFPHPQSVEFYLSMLENSGHDEAIAFDTRTGQVHVSPSLKEMAPPPPATIAWR